jgi:hypothetical protein
MAFYNTQHGQDLNLSKSKPAAKDSQELRKTAENPFFFLEFAGNCENRGPNH